MILHATLAAVLNAFRHQRTRNSRCGIPYTVTANCAQRLSASTNEERVTMPGRISAVHWCSTPFGINERGTRPGHGRDDFRPPVLNAFRHQRTRNRGPRNLLRHRSLGRLFSWMSCAAPSRRRVNANLGLRRKSQYRHILLSSLELAQPLRDIHASRRPGKSHEVLPSLGNWHISRDTNIHHGDIRESSVMRESTRCRVPGPHRAVIRYER